MFYPPDDVFSNEQLESFSRMARRRLAHSAARPKLIQYTATACAKKCFSGRPTLAADEATGSGLALLGHNALWVLLPGGSQVTLVAAPNDQVPTRQRRPTHLNMANLWSHGLDRQLA